MIAHINEKEGLLELIFLYRERHGRLAFLLVTFLLLFGLPLLFVFILHFSLIPAVIFGLPLFCLFFGLLWALWGKRKLRVTAQQMELSELVGEWTYQKKVVLIKDLKNMHLHYEASYDCHECAERVVFDGLVFMKNDDHVFKPFLDLSLDESESKILEQKLNDYLKLPAPATCSCRQLKGN
ncbi:MAG: hypothetical protein HQL24_03570 [Candidatus Omnitrophica bacterium]|nr:hypothetical protein [Candidatus Omnitrophota bacterium]